MAIRVVVALCAFALLATALAAAAQPASATGLSDQISANRSGQLHAERAMRTQDRVLTQIKSARKQALKDLKRARRELKRGHTTLGAATSVLQERRARYARVDDLYEDSSTAPLPEIYEQRLASVRREIRIAERRKATIGTRVRAMARSVRAKEARLRSLKQQRRVAVSRREAAEGALASRIIGMTSLAQARVENKASVSLAAGASFSWPTTGRISQTYGCTGFYLNPRRGSCRHFHDGVDIVDAYGTPVRAVAVGVVAFAGWNPWDEGGRAWIVVVVHPDGYVSRYGHMVPTDRIHAGELVHTGQVIGKMGNTGRSTGTHLHFELLRGGKDVNPMAYLPTGVIKIDKTSTRKGLQALKSKKKALVKKKAQAKKKAEATAEQKADQEALAAAAYEACEPAEPSEYGEDMYGYAIVADPAEGAYCAPDEVPAVAAESSVRPATKKPSARPSAAPQELPGVRRPSRGTSPLPA